MSFFGSNGKIKLLTSKDFVKGKLINKELSKRVTTILFFANWCFHCQSAKPLLTKIAEMTSCISCISAVDCETEKELVARLNKDLGSKGFKVEGYPTIVQFKNGEYYRTFNDERNAENLLKFVLGK